MFDLFAVQSGIMLIISIALFAAKVLAFVDCITRKEAKFHAVETLPKQTWLIILGLALIAHLINWNPISLLSLVGTVAALVYLAQVKAAG